MDKSASRDTLDETFDSLTPYEPEDVPQIEQVDTPPPVLAKPDSRLKSKLSALASPFKSSKGFHLKRGKEDGEDAGKKPKKNKKPVDSDEGGGEATDEEKKKKSKARSKAGAIVKRLGSLRGRKTEAAEEAPGSSQTTHSGGSVDKRVADSEDSVNDESVGSHYGSVEDVGVLPSPPKPLTEEQEQPVEADIVATNHPVSTLPFAVSTWKPKAKVAQVIERPIESPSPEDAARKRIAFVEQSSIYVSEDRDSADSDGSEDKTPAAVPRLSRMVHLAKLQLSTDRPSRSSSPARNEEHSHKTDDEEYQDTEEHQEKAAKLEENEERPEQPAMPPPPPHGDIIEGPSTSSGADMGTGTSTNPAFPSDRREHLYKILVIGELGTGKTSIIKRYVHQFFSQHYRATIGVDFALKVLNWDSTTTVRLQLWDIAGQERFGNMTRVYYKEAVAAFVVFDVTRTATFEAVIKWKQDLDTKVQLPDGSPIPCVLLANKCDQPKEGLINNPTKMEEYCREKGFITWFETSAKENINIEDAARCLVTKILQNDKLITTGDGQDPDKIILDRTGPGGTDPSTKKKCAC